MKKNKKITLAIFVFLSVIIGFIYLDNGKASLFMENKKYYSFDEAIEKIENLELDKINKKYNTLFLEMNEIVEKEIINIDKNKIKVIFTASAKGNSLHEFIYIFEIKDGKVIKIKESIK